MSGMKINEIGSSPRRRYIHNADIMPNCGHIRSTADISKLYEIAAINKKSNLWRYGGDIHGRNSL